MNDRQKAKDLEAKQLRYAEHWKKQFRMPIPEDEYPPEWHVADRWRCLNDHVCIGVTRLHNCRACSANGDADVLVVRTSPQDETGPFDFDKELAAADQASAVGPASDCADEN